MKLAKRLIKQIKVIQSTSSLMTSINGRAVLTRERSNKRFSRRPHYELSYLILQKTKSARQNYGTNLFSQKKNPKKTMAWKAKLGLEHRPGQKAKN